MTDSVTYRLFNHWSSSAAIIASALVASSSVLAQTQNSTASPDPDDIVAFDDWDSSDLETGWSAEEIMDTEVFGANGEEIGSVENLLIDPDGGVVAVIAQVGGFWDIGDTHIAVPWEEAELRNEDVHIPVTEDNVGDYSLFKEGYYTQFDEGEITTVEDDLQTGSGLWKATSLLDDYVLLEDSVRYGYIDDIIFSDGGQLETMVVTAANPTYGYGHYGYPWYGYEAWHPGLDYYNVPITVEEIPAVDE